jgi:glycosyltransferase involved in cell wall biosynthesis
MNVLVLAALTEATGNAVTSRRIADLLGSAHRVTLLDSVGATASSVKAVVQAEQIEAAVGVHALLSGPFLRALEIPYLLVFGGTDLYEPMHELQQKQMARAVAGAGRLLAFSPENRARAEWMWPQCRGRVELMPQAVAVPPSETYSLRDALNLVPEDFLFLLPTGIRRVKDPLHLVDAFSAWHREDPRMHLAIVGAILEPDYAEMALPILRGTPGVHCVDPLPRPAMLAAIAEADVVLNTSLSEGMCGVVLESMLLGTPVVARRNAGNQSVIVHGHTGLLYDEPSEMIEWARALTLSADLRHRIARTAKARIGAAHSPSLERETYLRIVEEMADTRPSMLPPPGPAIDEIGRTKEVARALGMPPSLLGTIGETVAKIEADPELARTTKELAGLLATAPPSVAITEVGRRLDACSLSSGERRALRMVLAMMQVSDATARAQARGVSDAIIGATLSDLTIWSAHFERLYADHSDGAEGGLTLEILGWCQRFLRGELFRVGPLQFDLKPFATAMRVYRHDKTRALKARTLDGCSIDLSTGLTAEGVLPPLDTRWQVVLEPGSPMLDMRIPGAVRMVTMTDVAHGMRDAFALFSRLSPETVPLGVCGESWRLDPQVLELFADEPGVHDLQRACSLYPSSITEEVTLRRIFGPEMSRDALAAHSARSPVESRLMGFLSDASRHLSARGGFVLREELERMPDWEKPEGSA